MDSGESEKKQVRVSIFNQTFSLVTTGDPADVEESARAVDELMRLYARAGNVDAARLAILAALHLADQIRVLERDLEALKDRTRAKHREFATLLDQTLAR